jgi:signal transduction histidine kinase
VSPLTRSWTEPVSRGPASAEAALVERIEALSFLRALNDRLAAAPDFASACRALVELVWEARPAEAVAYLSIDVQRGCARVEAVMPAAGDEPAPDLPLDTPPLPLLLPGGEPLVLLDAPPWLRVDAAAGHGIVLSAPTRIRDATTGLLLSFYARGGMAVLEEDRRILALVATSAALALDAARSQAREEFLATLRHDISNPVHAAVGHSEMLIDRLRASGDRDAAALAGSVLESLKVVADLVSNYLHMSAIDRGVPALQRDHVDLGALAAEVVERYRPSAAERAVAIECRGGTVAVRADRRQLGRVVANLVSNAVKYTPLPGRIVVTVAAENDAVTLAVADTGYGIAAADLPRLFARYARFHRDRGIPGTGLGLHISRAIVEAHGGTIAVESAPGRGSTFTVRLPAR